MDSLAQVEVEMNLVLHVAVLYLLGVFSVALGGSSRCSAMVMTMTIYFVVGWVDARAAV
jgi:hypothetical protein